MSNLLGQIHSRTVLTKSESIGLMQHEHGKQ